MALTDDLPTLLDLVEGPMVAIRHDLHAHPELSFAEHRTSQVIRARLEELGWRLEDCPTETGAVATLEGLPGRHVLIRADIDALPVTEETNLTFASQTEGVMHACGHDVHTAAALGVADMLARLRDAGELVGLFTMVFQPAEEASGGALSMIENGLLEGRDVDYVIGAHVSSLGPVGFVTGRAGVIMSEAHAFEIHLSGAGGHGAMSSHVGNVVLAVSALAPRLGEVVDGLVFDGTACACSAGVISAGSAANVVPRHARLSGTLRTFTDDQRDEALARLHSLVDAVASQFSVTARVDFTFSTPAVTNDARAIEIVTDALASAPGVLYAEMGPVSPSDDVSELLNRVPGCYLFVGGAAPDGSSGMHHSPDFMVVDESCRVFATTIATGALALARS